MGKGPKTGARSCRCSQAALSNRWYIRLSKESGGRSRPRSASLPTAWAVSRLSAGWARSRSQARRARCRAGSHRSGAGVGAGPARRNGRMRPSRAISSVCAASATSIRSAPQMPSARPMASASALAASRSPPPASRVRVNSVRASPITARSMRKGLIAQLRPLRHATAGRYHRNANADATRAAPGERQRLRWQYDASGTLGRWQSARQALAEKGFFYVARLAAMWASFPLWQIYSKVFPRGFTYQSVRYAYFLHQYNLTWSNERAVEIPIVRAALHARHGGRVLEVGNVLSHYFDVGHEVLDKFERANRRTAVRNDDVATFRADQPYDLIVSISTLEHVGWDEEPRDPGKIARAIANLCDQLAPGGRLMVTLPLGYNRFLDGLLAAGALPFSRCYYLKREGLTTWSEVDWPAVAGSAYGERWPGTRGLVIGVFDRGAP